MKIIIKCDDESISDLVVMHHVKAVIQDGLVSENNTAYCFITKWANGISVYADKTKAGTHVFNVWRVNK